MGIVINRPTDMEVDEILEQLDIDGQIFEHPEPVFAGGPVHTDRGFVLHRRDHQKWDASIEVTDTVALTTSLDILEAIAHNLGPSQCLIALGYAGWDAGQLEEEIQSNTWLTLPADEEVLFNVPSDKKVDAALAMLGITFSQLGSDSGHA
ncbi:YqgE/AlgH family protein [Zhongshania borealis]|uniref:YqgE/AlgH family protein n=2 Tax=Zhongshania borealis TaxID=889488 RepID=A0ABP7WQ30_9GAMM